MSPEQKHQRKSYKESEDEMLHFQNFGVSFIETRTPGEQFKEHKYDNFPLCLLHSFTEIIIFLNTRDKLRNVIALTFIYTLTSF